MSTRYRKSRLPKAAPLKFEGLADLLSRLEVEAEKVLRKVVDRAEQSSRDLKKGIQSLIDQVRTEGLVTVASEKRDEVRRIAEEVLHRAKEIQFLSLGNINRDEIVREAKKNLDDLIGRISASEFVARAKVSAINTKTQVLSILSIPSQEEVVKLSRKITSLESRVSKLTRKAA